MMPQTPREKVDHWLFRYELKSGADFEQIERLRAQLAGLSERQLGKFLGWLAECGALRDGIAGEPQEAGPDGRAFDHLAVRMRGFGLPRAKRKLRLGSLGL